MITDLDLQTISTREIEPRAIKVFHNNPRTGVFDIKEIALADLAVEIMKLRGMLYWYADPANYDVYWTGNSPVQMDHGSRAREVLQPDIPR
jgi:hypothetical protein